ncbi:unnamed protein product [Pedinophyceae sp. YPF-701]|nr:unnamed protein product [Pedinophyceae sp. YPF-701]
MLFRHSSCTCGNTHKHAPTGQRAPARTRHVRAAGRCRRRTHQLQNARHDGGLADGAEARKGALRLGVAQDDPVQLRDVHLVALGARGHVVREPLPREHRPRALVQRRLDLVNHLRRGLVDHLAQVLLQTQLLQGLAVVHRRPHLRRPGARGSAATIFRTWRAQRRAHGPGHHAREEAASRSSRSHLAHEPLDTFQDVAGGLHFGLHSRDGRILLPRPLLRRRAP